MGGSIVFIIMYWVRRWTGRDRGAKIGKGENEPAGGLARSPSGNPLPPGPLGHGMGSVKSFYSSDPTGSEVEIAIQPGSARYAGGQMMMPQSGARPGVLGGGGWVGWWCCCGGSLVWGGCGGMQPRAGVATGSGCLPATLPHVDGCSGNTS